MDTDQRAGTCFAEYHGTGARVVEVWVVEEVGAQNRSSAVVTGRARFFLRGVPADPQEDLVGEFLGYAEGS